MNNIADIRRDYQLKSLQENEAKANAIDQFGVWWNEAIESAIDEVNAFTLATSSLEGKPSARIVLLKGYDEKGFVFFTNYNSKKGQELAINPQASMVFFWKELERQIRIEGTIAKVNAEESDAYFFSRPVGSQIGAWSSPQSTVIESRAVIESNLDKFQTHFSQAPITRPPHWGGYCLKPEYIEFWQGRSSRLHDRLAYSLLENGAWSMARLAP